MNSYDIHWNTEFSCKDYNTPLQRKTDVELKWIIWLTQILLTKLNIDRDFMPRIKISYNPTWPNYLSSFPEGFRHCCSRCVLLVQFHRSCAAVGTQCEVGKTSNGRAGNWYVVLDNGMPVASLNVLRKYTNKYPSTCIRMIWVHFVSTKSDLCLPLLWSSLYRVMLTLLWLDPITYVCRFFYINAIDISYFIGKYLFKSMLPIVNKPL